MKRPSFQFYPSDWLRDTALRTCSIGARGLWIDMICFMHQGNPYGTLKVGNKVILPVNLAVMVGATLQEVEGWIDELESTKVFDRDEQGAIVSRRMIRDEIVRNSRAEGGKKGGNPALKVGNKVNLPDNLRDESKVNQNPTPSSSSSSSSSNSLNHSDEIKKNNKFTKPSPQEVTEYAKTINFKLDGNEFCDYYASKGWVIGKTPMKDWQAAVRTWKKHAKPEQIADPPKTKIFID